MLPISPNLPLTPSELIFLNGEMFAPKASLVNKVKLMHTDLGVSGPDLVQAILATAVLANQQAGAVRLESREKKVMLGLSRINALYVEPYMLVGWPANSLEATVSRLATQFQADKGNNDVENIVYALLEHKSPAPWQLVVELVKAGLAGRGLVEVETQTTLKVFASRQYSLPESTRRLAASQPVQPLQQWLSGWEKQQPETWKLLKDGIKKALERRTEKQNTSI
jgi:hypothetical protein